MTLDQAMALSIGDYVHAGFPEYTLFVVERVQQKYRTLTGVFTLIDVRLDRGPFGDETSNDKTYSYPNSYLEPGRGPGAFHSERGE